MNHVPNQFPSHPVPDRRIALIGECPARFECERGIPFVGKAGSLLWDALHEHDIRRSQVFVGNVCQERVPDDKIDRLKWDDERIQRGIATLREELVRYQPTLLVALGGTALRALTGEKRSIDAWKNTVFSCDFTGVPVKCLATFHPAALLYQEKQQFFFHFQMERLALESTSPLLVRPSRTIHVHTSASSACEALRSLHGQRLAFDIEGYAKGGCTSFALAPSAAEAHVFPFRRSGSPPVYGEHEETVWSGFAALVDSLDLSERWRTPASQILVNPVERTVAVEKPPKGLILHNALYDAFVLSYSRGLHVHQAIADDTMVLWWELFSEISKSLADLASCLTREPAWKHERDHDDEQIQWNYNGKDACITFECCEALYARPELTPAAYTHYAFNMALLPAILYMELRGIRFDDEARDRLQTLIQRRVDLLQDALNRKAGIILPSNEKELITHLKTLCVKKPRRFVEVPWTPKSGPRKGQALTKTESTPCEIVTLDDCIEFARSEHREAIGSVRALWTGANPGTGPVSGVNPIPHPIAAAIFRARLSKALGIHLNISSPKANDYLYGPPPGLNLPPQYKLENGRKTDRLTHDADAILSSFFLTRRDRKYRYAESTLKLWLRLASNQTQLETLSKPPDFDSRMRCSYNAMSRDDRGAAITKTGRFTCSESAAGVGYNLQTVTKDHRSMFRADPGCLMGQSDLSAADGWTLAAHCAALGDTTMLDDMRAGLKPAKVNTLFMIHGPVVNSWTRDAIKQACKELPDDWRYLANKRVAWGSAYLMGLAKMAEQIAADAYNQDGLLVWLPVAQCKPIQNAFFTRYWGIPLWQKAIGKQVLEEGFITSASGHVRRFFGQRWEWQSNGCDDHKVPVLKRSFHGDALSNEPQENTSLATKMALFNLYYSPENRQGDLTVFCGGFPRFRCEPLHTVHDSLVTQFREADREWASTFLRECFNNVLTIAGQPIVIPVSSECGADWGMKPAEKL